MTINGNPRPDVYRYLERIGFSGSLNTSRDTLDQLQECHLHTVPYENLDILMGVPLSLDPAHLFHKIVTQRRGGYCFELNALFRWLLEELGYPITSFMARFWRDEQNLPPKRRHHVLQVALDDRVYLCDVGVGGVIPRRPLPIIAGLEHQQGEECYRLERDPDFGWMLWEQTGTHWSKLYSFSEEPQLGKDFTMATYWCEHAPDSIFTKGAMVALRTREGRKTIAGNELRVHTANGVATSDLGTPAAFRQALHEHFGIMLPETHNLEWRS